MERRDFIVSREDTKNYNLNLVGVRSKDKATHAFNDRFCVFWKYKGQWQIRIFTVTLDPGMFFYGDEQMKDSGIDEAILLNGQYEGMFTIGKHITQDLSLVQGGGANIIRGFDKEKRTEFYSIPRDCMLGPEYLSDNKKVLMRDCINDEGKKVAITQWGNFRLNTFKANAINNQKDAKNWITGGIGWEGDSEHDELLILCIEAAKQGFEFLDFTAMNEEDIF